MLAKQHQQQGFFVLLLVLVQLIAHTILNVVVDDEVELFFCKAVMLGALKDFKSEYAEIGTSGLVTL